MVNVLHGYGNTLGLEAGDRTLFNLNFFFDASALDIWLPLSRGCGIVIVTGDDARDPAYICRTISEHKVVAFTTVPSQLQVGRASAGCCSCSPAVYPYCAVTLPSRCPL